MPFTLKTRIKIIDSIINKFLVSQNEVEALQTINIIGSIKNLPIRNLKHIKENALSYDVISNSTKIKKSINKLLEEYNLGEISKNIIGKSDYDDDAPF